MSVCRCCDEQEFHKDQDLNEQCTRGCIVVIKRGTVSSTLVTCGVSCVSVGNVTYGMKLLQAKLTSKLRLAEAMDLCKSATESGQPLPPLPPPSSGSKISALLKHWVGPAAMSSTSSICNI